MTYGSGSDAITKSTTYTIQGWTASKWSDLLRQRWHYEDSSLPSWTGNITRWDWRHLAAAGESDSSGNAASYQQRSELFSYDGPKRNGYSYDSNGNITCDPLRCFEIRYNLLNLSFSISYTYNS